MRKKKKKLSQAQIAKMIAGKRRWLKAQKKTPKSAKVHAELSEALAAPAPKAKVAVIIVDAADLGDVLRGMS